MKKLHKRTRTSTRRPASNQNTRKAHKSGPDSIEERQVDSKSAWALASPRFDSSFWPKDENLGLNLNNLNLNANENLNIKNRPGNNRNRSRCNAVKEKPSSNSSNSVNGRSDFSIDIGEIDSDSELLLTPPKAKKLVEDICDIVCEDQKMDEELKDCNGSARTMSFETDHNEDDGQLGMPLGNFNFDKQNDPDLFSKNDESDNDIDTSMAVDSLDVIASKLSVLENENRRRDGQIEQLRESNRKREVQHEDMIKSFLQQSMYGRGMKKDNFCTHSQEQNRGSSDGLHEYEVLEVQKEIERLKDAHSEELVRMKEEYKQDILDLQDRMLQWMCSRVELVQQQDHTILQLQNEVESLRYEYNELKKSSTEAFDKATQSVEMNCSNLKSYVQEEIKESENESKMTIEKLKADLKRAEETIEDLQKSSNEQCKDCQPNFSSLDEVGCSTRKLQMGVIFDQQDDSNDDDKTTWNDFTVKFREAMEGNLPDTTTSPPSDASVVSKLQNYDTVTAAKLFKNLCYKSSPYSLSEKVTLSNPDSDFFDCGQNLDDDDVFVDAQS